MSESESRLLKARLYLIAPARPAGRGLSEFLPRVLEAGVDAVQLREKGLKDATLLEAALEARRIAAEFDALFIVNDRVDVAMASGADGVHLGQDDLPIEAVRKLQSSLMTGLSTHDPDQIDSSSARGASYVGVGPVYETPTKPGRPGVGLGLIRYAKESAKVPWFAIGDIDLETLPGVLEAGARRVSVLRCLVEANDPGDVARRMRKMIDEAG